MRTTLDIPDDLLKEARDLLGFKSKTDTITHALRELIRRHRIEELKALSGTMNLDMDLDRLRQRPRAKRRLRRSA